MPSSLHQVGQKHEPGLQIEQTKSGDTFSDI